MSLPTEQRFPVGIHISARCIGRSTFLNLASIWLIVVFILDMKMLEIFVTGHQIIFQIDML